jgi:hypothetical protein
MIRNLKVLGLLAFAALAMSAMFASAASAQKKGVLTTGATPSTHTTSTLHATQYGDTTHNYFRVGKDYVSCENSGVTMTSTPITGGTIEDNITMEPTYKDCYTFLPEEGHPEDRVATVFMEECDYTLHQPENLEGSHLKWTGNTTLYCPEGKTGPVVKIYQFGSQTSHSFQVCEIKVTPFSNKPHYIATVDSDAIVTTSPEVKKDDLTVTVTVKNFKVHKSGLCGSETTEDSEYINTLTVTATEGGKHDDVWISTKAE